PLPLLLDASAASDPGAVPRGARRPRLRLRHLPGRLPVESRDREAPGGTAAVARSRAARRARRLARGLGRRAAPALRPAVRAPERPALPAPQRARRSRKRRRRLPRAHARGIRAARRSAPPRARGVGARATGGTDGAAARRDERVAAQVA